MVLSNMTEHDGILIKRFNELDITVYGTVEKPLFKAKDIGDLLGIEKIRTTLENIDAEDKVLMVGPSKGGLQEQYFLTEEGLYEVLFISRKPLAKQFKKWVKNILKEIRITGKYEMQRHFEIQNKLNIEQTLIDSFYKKPVVYLGNLGTIEGENLAKFGYTNDIQKRVNTHKKEIGDFFILQHVVEFPQNSILEKQFREHNDIINRRVSKEFNGKVQTEILRFDQFFKMENALNIFTTIKQTIFIDKELVQFQHEKTMKELHIKCLEIENGRFELEAKIKHEFELEQEITKRLELEAKNKHEFELEQEITKRLELEAKNKHELELEKTRQMELELEIKKIELQLKTQETNKKESKSSNLVESIIPSVEEAKANMYFDFLETQTEYSSNPMDRITMKVLYGHFVEWVLRIDCKFPVPTQTAFTTEIVKHNEIHYMKIRGGNKKKTTGITNRKFISN